MYHVYYANIKHYLNDLKDFMYEFLKKGTYILSVPGRYISKNGCQSPFVFIIANSVQNSNLTYI